MMGGLMGTMASGLAWGTGTAIAHKAVNGVADAMFGDKEKEAAPVAAAAPAPVAAPSYAAAPSGPCDMDSRSFKSCIASNSSNVDACNHLYEALQACQRNHQFM